MLFVCNYDNGKGKPYTLTLDYKPLRWRCKDSQDVSIQDNDGVTHTIPFNSHYQTALYIHYIDYVFDVEDTLDKSLSFEIGQCFSSDLWNPNASNTGYSFMMLMLISNRTLDYEEFKEAVIVKANFRREYNMPSPYFTGIDHDWTFLEYVIKAMQDVRHITIEDGKIALVRKGYSWDQSKKDK